MKHTTLIHIDNKIIALENAMFDIKKKYII